MSESTEPVYYTADVCADLATLLEECVGRLEAWHVRIVGRNRLRAAAETLRGVGRAGAYPADPDQLRTIGFSIRAAHDFRYIAACLPGDRLREIAVDLQRSVAGNLDERSNDRSGYQYQTQLTLGAAIAFSGHTPVIPVFESAARADYYVRNGGCLYAIEVKRPGSASSARKRLKKAASQLASTPVHMGAVVLELTDLLPVAETMIVAQGAADAERRRLSEAMEAASLKLEEQIFDAERRRFRAGYQHVGAYLGFVRGCVWNLEDLRHPILFRQARFARFSATPGQTLWWHRAQWLANLLYSGTEAMGHRVWRSDERPIWPEHDDGKGRGRYPVVDTQR